MKKHLLFLSLLIFLGFQGKAQNQIVSEGSYFEGEPYLVMNPTNSQHLVAAWMGFQFNNKVVIKTSVSNNGGNSWSSPIWQTHLSPNFSSADVSLGYDHLGNLFMCYIDYDNVNFSAGKVVVRKSSDGGLSWGNATIVLDISSCPNQLCIDRPWMAIDQTSGPNAGTIYVTNMNADQPTMITPPYHPYISISTDGGQSFQSEQLDATGFFSGSVIPQPMPSPVVTADGRFTALYPSYVPSQSLLPRLIRAESNNQGQTYTYDVAYQGQGFGTTNTLVKAGPLLKAHPNNANQMSYFFLSDDFGEADIVFIETSNNGLSWSAPTRVNQDPIGNGKIQDLIWANYATNGDLAVCWRDRRNANGTGYSVSSEIFCTVRNANTSTWMNDFSVSDQAVDHLTVLEDSGNDFMNVILENDTLNVIWGDVRSGSLKIYFSKRGIYDTTNHLFSLPEAERIVFPNPISTDLSIPTEFIGADYYLISKEGKSIQNGKIRSSLLEFETVPAGSYQLLIISAEKRHQYHLIKH
ncbi:MAG: hypothetical protein RLZZ243_692 [Bacteroidota bacterium]|jgi:hypothetical protein